MADDIKPMNLYEVYCGETAWGTDDNGDECIIDVYYHMVAPTRGRAKYLFLREEMGSGYELTDPMRIILKAKNVDLPEGMDEDYVWALANDPNFRLVEY